MGLLKRDYEIRWIEKAFMLMQLKYAMYTSPYLRSDYMVEASLAALKHVRKFWYSPLELP